MTKLQDRERSIKTMTDNQRWLDENAGKVVRAGDSDLGSLDRWNAEGGAQNREDHQ